MSFRLPEKLVLVLFWAVSRWGCEHFAHQLTKPLQSFKVEKKHTPRDVGEGKVNVKLSEVEDAGLYGSNPAASSPVRRMNTRVHEINEMHLDRESAIPLPDFEIRPPFSRLWTPRCACKVYIHYLHQMCTFTLSFFDAVHARHPRYCSSPETDC